MTDQPMTEPSVRQFPEPEPIRHSDLPCIPPPESEIFTWFPHPDGGGDMVRGQRQRGVQVRRRVSYSDWEPVRPDRWADEPTGQEAPAATQPPLPALLARLIVEGAHHARAASQTTREEVARVHEGIAAEAHMAAVYVADLIATGRMRHPGYEVTADDAIQARRVADNLSRHPATRSDAISAAIYGGATSTDPVIEVSEAEAHASARRSLAALGLTYEQLADQARRGDFVSSQAHALWVSIGGTIDPARLTPATDDGLREHIGRIRAALGTREAS